MIEKADGYPEFNGLIFSPRIAAYDPCTQARFHTGLKPSPPPPAITNAGGTIPGDNRNSGF